MGLKRVLLWSLPLLALASLVLACVYPTAALENALYRLCIWLPAKVVGYDQLGALLVQAAQTVNPLATTPDSEDTDAVLCEMASRLRLHSKVSQIRTAEAASAFESSCRKFVGSLDPEAQRTLKFRLRNNILAHNLDAPSEAPQLLDPLPLESCVDKGAPRKKESELQGMAANLVKKWRSMNKTGTLPLRDHFAVAPSKIADSLKRGQPARFDGRGLIPARMFNTTYEDLYKLHPDQDIRFHATSDAHHGVEDDRCIRILYSVTSYLTFAKPQSLLAFLLERGLAKGILRNICNEQWTLKELVEKSRGFEPLPAHGGLEFREFLFLLSNFQSVASRGWALLESNINLQQLPRWTKGEVGAQDLAEKVGLGGQVEDVLSFLTFGSATGDARMDVQDKLLVQLTGASTVFIVPPNCSFSVKSIQSPIVADWEYYFRDERLPYYMFTLRPGDAVAIPSNSLHFVHSHDPNRMAMSLFFEPRAGKMNWPASPFNFYSFADEGHLALRNLWVKIAKDMRDSRDASAQSFIMYGTNLELL